MILNNYKHLLGKVNANRIFGAPPGAWVVKSYVAGGGFAGAPEQFRLEQTTPETINNEQAEFPQPGPQVQYVIGGLW